MNFIKILLISSILFSAPAFAGLTISSHQFSNSTIDNLDPEKMSKVKYHKQIKQQFLILYKNAPLPFIETRLEAIALSSDAAVDNLGSEEIKLVAEKEALEDLKKEKEKTQK